MSNFEYFTEETEKYNFIKNYLHGNILDVTNGTFFSYTASKLLFSNENINEIWNFDITNSEKNFSCRRFSKNKIYLETKNDLPEKYFDFVISSNSIEFSPNSSSHIDFLSQLLTDTGMLIIRFTNKELSSKINFRIDYNDLPITEFSKNDIDILLENKFSNIDFFSQRLIDNNDLQTKNSKLFTKFQLKVESLLKDILLKLDKKQKFYIKFIQGDHWQPKKTIFSKNITIDPAIFEPVPYNKSHKPLFLIAMCSKKIN